MDIQAKIGLRIKEIRNNKNLTQEAVAFKAEIDRTYMNHVEKGKRNVSIVLLEKILYQGLETTFEDFFVGEIFYDKKRMKR
jgi:transcriptional regulator with XRE-family HTH domain